MNEIDSMLEQWIHNSIVRKKLRDLIIKVVADASPKPKYDVVLDESDYVDEDED
tara:strand:+ start:815 stop:976 length:162 start_codon:yes stop_codon:yes gene_type:complete